MKSTVRVLLVSLVLGLPHGALCIHFAKRPVNTEVMEGQTAVLECKVDHRKPCETVYWAFRWDHYDGLWRYIMIDGRPDIGHEDIVADIGRSHFTDRGVYSHSRSLETDGDRSGMADAETYALRISNATHLDSGLYMCISKLAYLANEESGLDTSSVARLDVILIPDGQGILSCQQSVGANPLSVYLNCMVVNESLLTEDFRLTWMRNRQELSSVRKKTNILLYEIQQDDNGQTFHCALKEPGNEVARVTCTVQPFFRQPTVSLEPSSLIVYEGTDAIFTCVASGVPSIKMFLWYVGDIRIFTSGTGNSISNHDQSFTSTFRVKGIRASDDNKRVVCVAAVSFGVSANQSSQLTVRSVDVFETVLVPDGRITAVQETSLFFRCTIEPAELNEIASYSWLVDGVVVYGDAAAASNDSSTAPSVTRPAVSGLQVGIVGDGATGSILHVKNSGSSLNPVNITCKLAVANLEARQKSCLLSSVGSVDESMVKYVVITVGTGGACFVLGMLAAAFLVTYYPLKFFKRRDGRRSGEDVTTHSRKDSSEKQKKQCQSEKKPVVEETSKHAVAKGVQHTYADMNRVDGDKSELGMHENTLLDAYEQIPIDAMAPGRHATLPKLKDKTLQNQPLGSTMKIEGSKAGDVEVDKKVRKLVKKWSSAKDDSGYEIPTALTTESAVNKIN